MRSLKNKQCFLLTKCLFLSICTREMTVDCPAVFRFNDFHRDMSGDWFFAIKSNKRGKIILFEKSQDFLTVFFTIIFWNVHGCTLYEFDFPIVFVYKCC